MLKIILQDEWENDDIINVSMNKFLIWTQHCVSLSLYIQEWFLVLHKSHIEFLLFSVTYDDEFRMIRSMNKKLMKVVDCIYDEDMRVFRNDCNDLALLFHWIVIDFNHFVEISQIYNHAFFANFIWKISSNHEYWETEIDELSQKSHFALLVQFVERKINNLSFLSLYRVYAREFENCIWFQDNWHSFFLEYCNYRVFIFEKILIFINQID